jgi:nicotinate-nucleotide adenylyltransferase
VKYCIFGGSFDPPHEGHGYLAECARDSFRFDKIFWVPAPDPPHKTRPLTPFSHRLSMVKAFIGAKAGYAASDIESRLPAPSYSLHTIRALKSEYGSEHDWHFLIGADNWSIFPTWHRGDEVLEEVTMVVFPRQGHPLRDLPNGVVRLDLPEVHIESRRIRAQLEATHDFDQARVPMEIRPYIMLNRLYGMGDAP